jgi:hypothetical protein
MNENGRDTCAAARSSSHLSRCKSLTSRNVPGSVNPAGLGGYLGGGDDACASSDAVSSNDVRAVLSVWLPVEYKLIVRPGGAL